MARRALIVDDSPSMRQLVGRSMVNAGYQVVEAGDGAEALKATKGGNAFDVVITDLNMPVMDGITFIQQLRTNPNYKFTPIVLLTTETRAEQKGRARAAGASAWLSKPFDPPTLMNVLQRVLP